MVANEEFMAWLTGQKSMPFGPNGEHTTVRLIDFDDPEDSANQWMISTEVTFKQGRVEKRFDLVLWCNGFPLVVGEAKSPVRPAYTWIDGAAQIHDDYEQSVPQFFVPNVLLVRHRGQGLPLRHGRHAGRAVGAVARGGDRRGRSGQDRSGGGARRPSRAC